MIGPEYQETGDTVRSGLGSWQNVTGQLENEHSSGGLFFPELPLPAKEIGNDLAAF